MTKKTLATQPVAIFDFDGTITRKSTTISFLRFVYGPSFMLKLSGQLRSLILYYLGKMNVDELNRVIADTFFKNLSQDYLYERGAAFSNEVLPPLIRKSAHQRIKWHKAQGHHCILATAAYNLYIDHWSGKNGFDEIASTRIGFDAAGRATGYLEGRSCYGDEKLRRVLDLIGNTPRIVYAYGDSAGDKAILDYATYPYYRFFQ